MLKIILLITPVFISLFWAIALNGNKKSHTIPRTYLSKIMFLSVICFFSHFLYFAGEKEAYLYFDIILQFAGFAFFPAYYIYFRLLTVDEKFSLKAHARYLIPSLIVAAIYAAGALLAPIEEYKAFLFDRTVFPNSPYLNFMRGFGTFLRIYFFILIFITYGANYLLLKRYGDKAEQYYSDVNDGKYNNGKLLNYSILFMCIGALVAFAFGRFSLYFHDKIVYLLWSIFSITIYIIGYMGLKQKRINPTFDLEVEENNNLQVETNLKEVQELNLKKIRLLFDNNKIYLNPQLNIMEVVKEVGTNRSYISALINQKYNQNFCAFVNSYRIAELERVLNENPNSEIDKLALACGFGSISSMKRSISLKTGMSVAKWRKQNIVSK